MKIRASEKPESRDRTEHDGLGEEHLEGPDPGHEDLFGGEAVFEGDEFVRAPDDWASWPPFLTDSLRRFLAMRYQLMIVVRVSGTSEDSGRIWMKTPKMSWIQMHHLVEKLARIESVV